MQPLDCLNQVAQFHSTFKHPILPTPQIPSDDRCQLRVSLIAEELKELEEGIANKDIVEIADALADIQYVLAGAVLEFGLGDKFRALFDEVQRSNMSKACNSIAEAEATVAHYAAKGSDCYYKQDGDKYLVYRTADNKTLKSVAYSPADLASIVNG
jgi:predicted HAD superfamily Cof-like phosphohydrolase